MPGFGASLMGDEDLGMWGDIQDQNAYDLSENSENNESNEKNENFENITEIQEQTEESAELSENSENQNEIITEIEEENEGLADVKGWINDINPNYNPDDLDSPYASNCGSCAYAVEKRFDGDTEIAASSENIGSIEEMNSLTGMEQVSMSPEEIQNKLIEMGAGSHAIIGIDRSVGPGHWFNAYCPDGKKVYALDGQTGKVMDWPPDYGDVTNWDMSIKKA